LIRLDAEQIARLDEANDVFLGYSPERLCSEGIRAMLTGNRWKHIDRGDRVVW
jgi:hypothetical protein